MSNVGIVRLLLNQVNSLSLENHELWGFTRLTTEQTGLKYNIFVDDDKTYQNYNHDLWLYVECNENFKVPVTISKKPIVKKFIPQGKYDLSEVYTFIKTNTKLLENLANGNTTHDIVWDLVRNINGESLNESRNSIYKSTLKREETKLPTTIWVDEDKTYLPHAPRIKFRAVFQNHDTHKDPSMEIKNPDKIHNLPKNHNLNIREIEEIKEFVRNNEKLLLDLANRVIQLKDFKENMFLNNQKKERQELSKFVNGFAIVKKGEKYNYVDEYGNLLLDEYVDKATYFTLYDKDYMLAYVVKDGRGYYIDGNGEEVKL